MPGKPACVVEATLNYAHTPEAGERLEAFIGQVSEGKAALNVKTDPRVVTVTDFRGGDLEWVCTFLSPSSSTGLIMKRYRQLTMWAQSRPPSAATAL